MRALEKEGWLHVLHPHWNMAKVDTADLGQVVKTRQMMNDLGYQVETGPIAMYFLTRRMNDKDVSEIQRMIPRRDFNDKWKHLESGAQDLAKKLTSKEAGTVSGSWKILTHAAPENILFLSLTTKNQTVDQKLKNFFTKWRQVKEKLPFPEMAELRITAQLPEYQKILDEAFLLLLDGKLRSHTEIVNFLKPYEPPPPPPPPAPRRGRGKAAAAAANVGTPADGQPTTPAKRGRKPKGAPAAPAAAATAPAGLPAPEPAVTGVGRKSVPPAAQKAASAPPKKLAVPPAKKVAEAVKPAAPAKAVAKKAAPAKAQKKVGPAKKSAVTKKPTPAKKPVAKKAPVKKPVAKKAASKKK